MPAIKRSITVMDYRNHQFHDPNDNKDFKVVKAKNTTSYAIGEVLSVAKLEHIIRLGVDVTIIPYKRG